MTYEVSNIKYQIDREDVAYKFDEADFANPSDYYDALDNAIAELEEKLPTEMIVVVHSDNEYDTFDEIADAVERKAGGWMVFSFDYHEVV